MAGLLQGALLLASVVGQGSSWAQFDDAWPSRSEASVPFLNATSLLHPDTFRAQNGSQLAASYCAAGYDAVVALGQAMARVGARNVHDGEQVLAALRESDFQGLTGRVVFESNGDRANSTLSLSSFQQGAPGQGSFIEAGQLDDVGALALTDTILWADGTDQPPLDGAQCPEGTIFQDDPLVGKPFCSIRIGVVLDLSIEGGQVEQNIGNRQFGLAALIAAQHQSTHVGPCA